MKRAVFLSVLLSGLLLLGGMAVAAGFSPLRRVDVGPVKLATMVRPGKGTPILFIHGSFGDHGSLLPVARALVRMRKNPIIVYDRRGHSASTDVPGQGHIGDDVRDGLRLLTALGYRRAHVFGHSYGASVAIMMANTVPKRVVSLFLYEPPVFGLLRGKRAYRDMLGQTKAAMLRARGLLQRGKIESGTRAFVEGVAFGRGSWRRLFGPRARAVMMINADTWLDQARDPKRLTVPVRRLRRFFGNITLAYGEKTLPVYRAVAERAGHVVPAIRLEPCAGVGHGGPTSRPRMIARRIDAHLRQVSPRRSTGKSQQKGPKTRP